MTSVEKLMAGLCPDRSELVRLIEDGDPALLELGGRKARERFGSKVYLRGLIEFSNHCTQDCFYCGIRRSNRKAVRYRLDEAAILDCCAHGYQQGYRTFVLQSGEDPVWTDSRLVQLVREIKTVWPDCAVTLSVGQRNRHSYALLRQAGVDRYLLRHESADPAHFASLHPVAQTWASRRQCLDDLKAEGFQVGAGFMVGTPGQTAEHLAEDLLFLVSFQPHMVGIGPFLPHGDTPFARYDPGSVDRTLIMLALTRLLLPNCLLPATTALGSAGTDGLERGLLAGANVIMPNISPDECRSKYLLYNGKTSSGEEELKTRLSVLGFEAAVSRGDHVNAQ